MSEQQAAWRIFAAVNSWSGTIKPRKTKLSGWTSTAIHTDNLRDRKSAIYDALYGFVSVVVRVLAWALTPLVEVTGDSQITNVTSGSPEETL